MAKKIKVGNGELKIDHNIPAPQGSGRGRPRKYPWLEMDIGDSFLFPKGLNLSTASAAASAWGKRNNKKFTTRITADGMRCWRIS